jgi:hypothetical protein
MSDTLIIAVDFDGTIVEHEFPEIGPVVPGAFEWLRRWQAAGARLILWTMRSDGRTPDGSRANGPVLSEAVELCRANGVQFWGVNCNPDQAAWTKSPKAYAHIYVDDAALGCPLVAGSRPDSRPAVDWAKVGPAVLARLTEVAE